MREHSKINFGRLLAASSVLALAGIGVTAASAATLPAADASAEATAPPATVRDLHVGVKPIDNSSAGHYYVWLTFKNTSHHRVSMYGYSGVSFVAYGNGTQVGLPTGWEHNRRPHRVVLAPGAKTKELVTITDAGVYGGRTVRTDGFRVYIPDSRAAVFVPYKTRATTRHVRQLAVEPVGAKIP
ncbi:DUF4232 domain-containing protein [Microlunatus elymi]|uniref:DUF4232 domain-containing protein n=1 Tax=Microlunatus elymi TaxID=2596828 RepID=A0A516PYX9_9ACTN|nr:DUF4232 domain-containing protein [Microlunatus elymi]QDP96352.1 DUF4232 domain-containing protein [Microlunatus elymi]